ncbi:MAG: universal stress protein [Cyanobacteria bacterium SZAS LIN-2]|nr:universal stress protein [Cyanobacteria bacterium SZAS LIN-2]MBS2008113.1 universal stress protein [Cyanobacteria bacterium SZAS TMP-1]
MNILIALDGSECSKAAIDFVLARPWLPGDSFLIVHVVEPIPADMGINYVPTCTTLCDNAVFEAAHSLTDDAKARLEAGLPDHPVRCEVVSGMIKGEIIDLAKTWPADLIVMGSHGRKGVSRLFLGSVAEEVLKDAPCSVEIVKSDQHEHKHA